MNRAPFVIVATVAGVVGVLTFHTRRPPESVSLGAGGGSTTPAGGTSAPSSSSLSSAPPSSPRSSAPSSSSSAGSPTHSATGSIVRYGYGELAVRVTETGSRITAVQLVELNTAEQYSQSLAEQAAPTLAHEVVDAQSAHIQAVSGATYTSEAYAQSVQSALDAFRQ